MPQPGANDRRPVIHEGLPTQLPDIDPDETSDWVASLDAMVDERGRDRAAALIERWFPRDPDSGR